MTTTVSLLAAALVSGSAWAQPTPAAAPGDTGLHPSMGAAPLIFPYEREDPAPSTSGDTGLRLALADSWLDDQPKEPATPPQPAPASDAAPVGGGGDADLAKKLSNPVASLISVPFQFNYDTGYGPKDAERVVLNIQPVIPFSISEDWNVIVRTIVPVIYQGALADGVDSDFGMGDVVQSFFFSPKEPVGGWILAVGPVALWPTGTEPALRSEQFGLGPTVLALRQEKGWTYGALANQIWGVTESDDHPDVNATFVQPFVSYTWPTATTLALNTEATYDWTSEQWTVPVNLIGSQLVKIGGKPVQFSLGGKYYAESPDGGPEWGVRFVVTLLFPK
jgi:hypothetical protein